MDKIDSILKKLDDHDEKFERVMGKLDDHDGRFQVIDEKFERVMGKLDDHDGKFERMMTVLVDVQEDVRDMKPRMKHLEKTTEETFRRIDGFLVIMDRHEAEIAALRVANERILARLDRLEAQAA
jgi:chromosome segregation ATPase